MLPIKKITHQGTFSISKDTLTLKKLESYFAGQIEITLTTKDSWRGESCTVTGRLIRIDAFDGIYDALLWFDTYPFGIHMSDIETLFAPKIILDSSEAKSSNNTILLRTGAYAVYVDMEILKTKCCYFEKMFSVAMHESKLQEIDLSPTFDALSLQLLIEHLDEPAKPIINVKEALSLLISADIACHKELINKATEAFFFRVYNVELLKSLAKNSQSYQPQIIYLLNCLCSWSKAYPKLGIPALIKKHTEKFLHLDLEGYHNQLLKGCEHLSNLTGITWSYDGSRMIAEKNSTLSLAIPKYIHKLNKKIIEHLIARGFLSGKKGYPNPWICDINDVNELLTLDRAQLVSEIEEASNLISRITNVSCRSLRLDDVVDGSNYRVLEEIGCISHCNYYEFNVNISNFNLEKLRILCEKGITMSEITIWAPLVKEPSKNIDLFFQQIINFRKKTSSPDESSIAKSPFSFYRESIVEEHVEKTAGVRLEKF